MRTGRRVETAGRAVATMCVAAALALGGCSGGSGGIFGDKSEPGGSNHYGESDAYGYYPGGDGSADYSGWYGDEVAAQDDALAGDVGWAYPDAASPADSSADLPGGWNPPSDGCVPSCTNIQCGPDGCGGSCGWCSGTASCQNGVCVEVTGCEPACAGLMVGEPDGCGGVCTGGGFGIGLKPGGAQDVGYFRMLVGNGQVPAPDLFPVEGFLNEHDTPLPPPDYSMLVTLHPFLGLFYDPQKGEPLISMQLGMNSGLDPAKIAGKSFNLVVVADVSGSMADAGKLEYVKQGITLMLDSLDENDTLSIVTYSTMAQVAMGPTPVTDESRPKIKQIIDQMSPSGSTNLFGGLMLGYEMAMKNITDQDAVHRVMLLSDGNITAGESNLPTILGESNIYNEEGIGITTIGVGFDFNFDLMYQLASQGNGNFYFLDDGAKLVDVFQHEIEFLLTPVAQNLKIWFTLPPGFEVEAIYGFDYQVDPATGEVMLLGPSPQYSVGPQDPDPPDNPGGDDGGGVSVSTLYASKKNGLLMMKIRADKPNVFAAWNAMEFATITYSYELVGQGKMETATKKAEMGSLSYFEEDGDGPLAYFSGPIMQRNFCILRAGLAIKQACTLFNQQPQDVAGAISELADAITFCNGVNVSLNKDPALTDDVTFMEQVKDNICTLAQCQPQM